MTTRTVMEKTFVHKVMRITALGNPSKVKTFPFGDTVKAMTMASELNEKHSETGMFFVVQTVIKKNVKL
jgi:hypothetical protein